MTRPALAFDPTCIFCRIIAGTESAEIHSRRPEAIVLVPLNPVVTGHLLVVSQIHVADAGEAPDITASAMRVASELAADLDACNLITSRARAATQTIRHLHIHVVPRRTGDGLQLPWSSPPL